MNAYKIATFWVAFLQGCNLAMKYFFYCPTVFFIWLNFSTNAFCASIHHVDYFKSKIFFQNFLVPNPYPERIKEQVLFLKITHFQFFSVCL
jgi:hypothetical protein